jgi:hypothetical protein
MTSDIRWPRRALFAIAWTACLAVLAAEPTVDSVAVDGDLRAVAEGQVPRGVGSERLHGRFVIAWIGDREDDDALDIRFTPDAMPARLLLSDTDAVDGEITLSNRDAAVLALLGPELAARVLEGELAGVEGHATLVVEDLESVTECRESSYQARVTTVESTRVSRTWTPATRRAE